MALHITPRGHRNCNGAEKNADQTRKTQETAGAIDGILDLRTFLRDVEQSLAALLVREQPALEFDRCVRDHPRTARDSSRGCQAE